MKSQLSDRTFRIACNSCSGQTAHDVLWELPRSGAYEHIQWWETYRVLQCRGCESITFQQEEQNTEDLNPNTGELETSTTLYPARSKGFRTLDSEMLIRLPYNVRNLYGETHNALVSQLLGLAALGIGVTIEAVCADKDTPGASLRRKIADLVELRVLTERQAESLHVLRDFRNDAAHQFRIPTPNELAGLWEILTQILITVYKLPLLSKELRTRRDKLE